MKISRKKKKTADSVATIDYDKFLTEYSHDPFGFLNTLRSGDLIEDGFDPASLAGGRRSHSGVLNEEMLLKEVDIASMVRGVLDENSLVPKDIKIDDGDMPLAKNFYEWVTKDRYAGTVITPFLEQLVWGIVIYGEWCPRCSDNEWLINTHRVDDTFATFERKVCLLEHGICPSCKARKSELVKSGELPFYQEIAVNAGQRSGKSAWTGGMATPYLTHRVLKMQKPNDVYGIAGSTMLHGTFVALTYAQAKETLWEFYYGTLLESQWFCLDENSRVSLADGSTKPIKEIQVGDCVKTFEGESVVDRVFDNGVQECARVTLADNKVLEGTDEHEVQCLDQDGYLVWKKIGDLTEDDFVVVDDEND